MTLASLRSSKSGWLPVPCSWWAIWNRSKWPRWKAPKSIGVPLSRLGKAPKAPVAVAVCRADNAAMPRFSLKQMLIVVAVVAVWLSTLNGYPGANAIRHGVGLLVFVSAVAMTYCSNQRRRAFWVGVVTVMLILGSGSFYRFQPICDFD